MALGELGALALETGLPVLGGIYGGPGGLALGGFLGQGLGGALRHLTSEPSQNQLDTQDLIRQLQQPYQFNFQPIANEEMRRFQQQTVPSLAERFSGLDAQRSSAFRQSLGAAGSDLSSRLAALQAQTGLQSAGINQQRMGQLGSLLSGQQQMANQQDQYRQGLYNNMLGNAVQGYLGMGGQELQRQLGVGGLLGQAAGMQGNYNLGGLNGLSGLSGQGLNQGVSNMYQARQPGVLESVLGPLFTLGGNAIGTNYGLR